jgi:hypothetical protein
MTSAIQNQSTTYPLLVVFAVDEEHPPEPARPAGDPPGGGEPIESLAARVRALTFARLIDQPCRPRGRDLPCPISISRESCPSLSIRFLLRSSGNRNPD